MTETGSHWRTSCAINRALGGRRGQPLCARAWANGWHCFIEAMSLAFRDPCHCEAIFIRWLALQSYDPPPSPAGEGQTPVTDMRDILIEAAAFALTALIAFGLAVAEHP